MNTNDENSENAAKNTAKNAAHSADTQADSTATSSATQSKRPEPESMSKHPESIPATESAADEASEHKSDVTQIGPDPIVAERDHLKDQLLRTAADFDNFRKRARREIEDAKLRGRDDAVKDLLPVFDNLERAVSASEGAQNVDSVLEGVKMVLKLFQDTAERMGINRVQTVGQRFDPNVHEAIQQKETDEHPPGTIITEVVPGYLVGQRLLRAAMVVVARKPVPAAAGTAPAADAAGASEGEGASGGEQGTGGATE